MASKHPYATRNDSLGKSEKTLTYQLKPLWDAWTATGYEPLSATAPTIIVMMVCDEDKLRKVVWNDAKIPKQLRSARSIVGYDVRHNNGTCDNELMVRNDDRLRWNVRKNFKLSE